MSARAVLAPNVKPPLTGRLKASAAGAGILGFLFASVGWSLMVIAVAIGSIITAIAAAAVQQGATPDGEDTARLLRAFARALNVGTIPLVVAGVVGALIWILGLFISRGILRRGGHYRPWGITWAGLGIAILFSFVASAIGGVVGGIVTPILLSSVGHEVARGSATAATFQPLVTESIVYGIAYVVVTILIGWLAWSLMARALRPTAQQLADREARQSDRASKIAHRQRVEAEAAGRGVRPATVEGEERQAVPPASDS